MPSVKPGSKYHGLYLYLSHQRQAELRLTLARIERLIGSALPPGARHSRAFWSNRSRGALQAEAWMAAGYHVRQVDLEAGTVTFARARPVYTVHRQAGDILWDADLIRALRAHLGINQAGLADILGVRQQTVSEWETGVYAPTRGRSKHLTMVAEQAGFLHIAQPSEFDRRPRRPRRTE
ncbi:MAG: helix-turn-helix domain-containing protein [Chloroflexota bacterium]